MKNHDKIKKILDSLENSPIASYGHCLKMMHLCGVIIFMADTTADNVCGIKSDDPEQKERIIEVQDALLKISTLAGILDVDIRHEDFDKVVDLMDAYKESLCNQNTI